MIRGFLDSPSLTDPTVHGKQLLGHFCCRIGEGDYFLVYYVLFRKNVHFSKFIPLLPSAISVPPALWYSILLLLASLLIQMRLFLSIDFPLLLFQLRPVIIPLLAPKKYWRQPFGALLLKSLVYCVTNIDHLGFIRLFSLILKDNVVQASAASMYTEKKSTVD